MSKEVPPTEFENVLVGGLTAFGPVEFDRLSNVIKGRRICLGLQAGFKANQPHVRLFWRSGDSPFVADCPRREMQHKAAVASLSVMPTGSLLV